MNPVKMFKLYSAYTKLNDILKGSLPMNSKITHSIMLFSSLSGTFGVPLLAMNWLHKHEIAYTVFVGIAILLHALFPSLFADAPDSEKKATGYSDFKVGVIILVMLLGASALKAQNFGDVLSNGSNPNAVYAVGPSWSINASPSIAGTGLFAYPVADTNTYAYTSIDVLPNTMKPFTVTSNVAVGVGQKFGMFGKFPIYCTTGAGPSWTGDNVGWSYNFGCLTEFTIKGQRFLPTVRTLKSSVSNGTGLQPIIGVLYRF